MNTLDAFGALDQIRPFAEQSYDPETHQPQYVDHSKEHYDLYRTQAPTYGIAGYISPYPSNNWNTTSGVLSFVEDESRLPALDHRVDPNRIFTSDIAALRGLAADQNKITKMFEKKLIESLTDKGKFGLTEDDVEAMQALTSARSAIVSMQNAQVTIKKNIADLRIKQQQLNGGPGNNGVSSSMPIDGMDIGRSVMDNIFAMQAQSPTVVQYDAPVASLDTASEILDNIVPSVDDTVAYEPLKPKTIVLAGDSIEDSEYVTIGSDGKVISDYPNPTAPIKDIDYTNNTAVDTLDTHYDVQYKNKT